MKISQRIGPCLWFDDQAEDGRQALHRHLSELEDHADRPLQ